MDIKKKLLRQIKRSLGEEWVPPFEESDTSGKEIHLNKLSDFIERVNKSFDEYEDRLNISYRNLQISTEEIDKKHSEITHLNSALESILESLGEGLLVFGSDGIIQPTHSKVCETIFQTNVVGRHFLDLIGTSKEDKDSYSMWISLIFDGRLDEHAINELGPDSYINCKGQRFKMTFKPTQISGEIEAVTVVVADCTAAYEAKVKEQEQQRRARVLDNILRSRNDFNMFMKFYIEVLEEAQAKDLKTDSNYKQFKMNLHTIKGSAAFFALEDLSSLIQDLEERFKALPANNLEERKVIGSDAVMVLKDWQKNFMKEFKVLFSQDIDPTKSKVLNFDEIVSIVDKNLASEADRDEWVLEIVGDPIAESLLKLDDLAQKTAHKLGKKIEPVKFDCEDFKVITGRYNGLFASLNHVVRNAIDHGIEHPEERQRKGKPQKGTIEISAHLNEKNCDKFIHFVFKDDGRGFAFEKLRKKLDAQGVYGLQDNKIVIQKMIENEVSSKNETSDVSGFGIGISAVVEEVRRLGGQFSIESTPEKGSVVTISVPRFYYDELVEKTKNAA